MTLGLKIVVLLVFINGYKVMTFFFINGHIIVNITL